MRDSGLLGGCLPSGAGVSSLPPGSVEVDRPVKRMGGELLDPVFLKTQLNPAHPIFWDLLLTRNPML